MAFIGPGEQHRVITVMSYDEQHILKYINPKNNNYTHEKKYSLTLLYQTQVTNYGGWSHLIIINVVDFMSL